MKNKITPKTYVYFCSICGEPLPPRINKTDYCSRPCRVESIKRYNQAISCPTKKGCRLDKTAYLKIRFKILTRDNFTCQYCGRNVQDGVVLEIDHLKPISKGGNNALDNLVTACLECNSGKKDVLLNQRLERKIKENLANIG